VRVIAGVASGREAADMLLRIAAADRPDGLIISEDHVAAGLCERLGEGDDYRPVIAAMTNRQLPLTYALPVLCFENDIELLAAEAVKAVKDRLLDPGAAESMKLIPPKLRVNR